MTTPQAFNEEQRVRWNGADGEYWVRQQSRIDKTLSPVIPPLLAFAGPQPGSTIIDVGCGCGATTVELARAVGPQGRVVALDVSEPMLHLAADRTQPFGNTQCLLGDAATIPLQNLAAALIVSRFGVMFFGDPSAAFTNLRSGLHPGGRLRFACWRPIHENPWLHIPLQAVYEHAPHMPKPHPEEPGPFSFSDPARVARILTAAGFSKPSFTPLDLDLDISAGGTLEDAVTQAHSMGPAKRALANQPDDIRASAIASIRRALIPFRSSSGVRLPAAVWLVAADAVTS